MSVTQRGEVPETTDPEKWERESIRREAYGNAYAPGRGQKVMLLKAELGAVRPQAPGFSPPPWPLHLLLAMAGVSVRGTRSITAEWWRSAAGSPGVGRPAPLGHQAHWVSQAGGNIRDRRGGSFSHKKLIQKLITRRGANSHPPKKNC